MSTSARTSPENVTLRFDNHLSTIPSRFADKFVYNFFWKETGRRALALKKKSSSTDVVYITAKQVVSHLEKDKNVCEMHKI